MFFLNLKIIVCSFLFFRSYNESLGYWDEANIRYMRDSLYPGWITMLGL